ILLSHHADHVRDLGGRAGDADAAERAAAKAVQIELHAAGFEIELRRAAALEILRAAEIERPAQQEARETARRVRRLGERADKTSLTVGGEDREAHILFAGRPGHALPAIDQADVLDQRIVAAQVVVLVADLVPQQKRLRT